MIPLARRLVVYLIRDAMEFPSLLEPGKFYKIPPGKFEIINYNPPDLREAARELLELPYEG